MIISDLEHLEIVSEETQIEGSAGLRLPSFLDDFDVALIQSGAPAGIIRNAGSTTVLGTFTKVNNLRSQEIAPGLFTKYQYDETAIGIG
jgi:hypothetical protein